MDNKDQDDQSTSPPNEAGSPTTDTPQPNKAWYKDKRLLVCVGALVVLVVAALGYLGLARNSTPADSEPPKKSTTGQSGQAKKYVGQGYPGLSFKAPSGWVLVREDQGTGYYQLFSPDAVGNFGGYGSVSVGTGIALTIDSRDLALEAKKAKPLDAYIPAPTLGTQGTPNYFKNKQGVDMVGYTQSYEGCYMRVLFTSGQSLYSAQIDTGGKCPDETILASADVKAFIDSVQVGGESRVESDVYVTAGDPKSHDAYKIYAGTLEFELARFSDDQSGLALLQPVIIPKLKSDGSFEKLVMSFTAAQLASGYDCEGCGFTLETYDSSLVITATKPSLDGFTKLADNIYGKQEKVKSIQKDAVATKYTYVKTSKGGNFTLTSTVEQHNNDRTQHSLTLPAFMNTLDSLRVL